MSRKYFKITKCPEMSLATANRIIVSDKQGLFINNIRKLFRQLSFKLYIIILHVSCIILFVYYNIGVSILHF